MRKVKNSRAGTLVLALSLAASTTAQSGVDQPEQLLRRPCLGIVVDDTGAALANAEVTAVFTPGFAAPGALDVTHAATDARGRFKLELVVGRVYSVWAIGPPRNDGSRLVSEVARDAAPGVLVALDAWHVRQPRRLQLRGHDTWLDHGASARCLVFPDASGHFGIERPIVDGVVELPPTPHAVGAVGLVDARGEVMVLAGVTPDEREAEAEFMPPGRFGVQVAAAGGAPATGAHVEIELALAAELQGAPPCPSRWLRVATTDEAGRALWYGADCRRGLRVVHGASAIHAELDAARCAVEVPTARLFLPQQPERPKVVGRRDEHDHAAFGQVDCSAISQLVTGNRGASRWVSVPLTDLADAAAIPVATDWSMYVEHRLPRREGSPIVVARALPAPVPATQLHTDAKDEQAVQLQVLGLDGAPAPGVRVELWYAADEEGTSTPRCVARFALDAAGRSPLRLGPGCWALFAWTAEGSALRSFDATDLKAPLSMQLLPWPTQSLRVVDGKGEPVRGARVEVAGMVGISGFSHAVDSQLQQQIVLNHGLAHAQAARSDRNGRLVLPVLDSEHLMAPIRVVAGTKKSEVLRLTANVGEANLVVR